MISSKKSLAYLACVLLYHTNGFVPASRTATRDVKVKHRRRTSIHKERDYSLSNNDRILAEPMEPKDEKTINSIDKNILGETEEIPLLPEPLIPDINVVDQQEASDILLDSFTNSKPEDVLFLDVSEQINSIFTEQQPPPAAAGAEGEEEETQFLPVAGENILSGTEYADFSNSTNLSEDVLAVLEASGAAAVEAEATLSPDLIEQLDFSSSGSNSTSTMSTPLVVDEIPEILTASSVVGEAVTSTKIETPSVKKILKFAIPAIGVWLCGPLLSLIDTSAVGLFSGTAQQAALNPAVAVTDYAALLIVSPVSLLFVCVFSLPRCTQDDLSNHPLPPIFLSSLLGIHVHRCNQPSCSCTGKRQTYSRQGSDNENVNWSNAIEFFCRSWSWSLFVCFC